MPGRIHLSQIVAKMMQIFSSLENYEHTKNSSKERLWQRGESKVFFKEFPKKTSDAQDKLVSLLSEQQYVFCEE